MSGVDKFDAILQMLNEMRQESASEKREDAAESAALQEIAQGVADIATILDKPEAPEPEDTKSIAVMEAISATLSAMLAEKRKPLPALASPAITVQPAPVQVIEAPPWNELRVMFERNGPNGEITGAVIKRA